MISMKLPDNQGPQVPKYAPHQSQQQLEYSFLANSSIPQELFPCKNQDIHASSKLNSNSANSQHREIYSLLIQTYVKTLRSLEDAPIFLASLTNSWSVDNWEQLLNIVNKKFVEQPIISLLQTAMKNKIE